MSDKPTLAERLNALGAEPRGRTDLLAMVPRFVALVVESLPPRGTPGSDLLRVATASQQGSPVPADALARLVADISWSPWSHPDKRVRLAFARYEERARERVRLAPDADRACSRADLRRDLLGSGLLLALDPMQGPIERPIRFSREWVTGDDGRQLLLAPNELLRHVGFGRWLRQATASAATAILLDEPVGPKLDDDVEGELRAARAADVLSRRGEGAPELVGESRDALAADDPSALVLEDGTRPDNPLLLLAWEVATPRQAEMMTLLAEGAATAEAADALGVSEGGFQRPRSDTYRSTASSAIRCGNSAIWHASGTTRCRGVALCS